MNVSLLIVVPTFNSYSLLPCLLTSLQNQSWSHWRLLFIDGPSAPDHRTWLDQCCSSDSRCSWVIQDPSEPGIFGAMNQGFAEAQPNDWLLFWGSDDWAAGSSVLSQLVSALEFADAERAFPDLVVCRGRYVDASSGVPSRSTVFHPAGVLSTAAFRRALRFGSTLRTRPPCSAQAPLAV